LGPAGGLEEGADVLLLGGRERTGAVVVLVVAFATIALDETGLDAALHPAWDVVVDGLDAYSHANGLVSAIHEALFRLSVWLGEVDTHGDKAILWYIGSYECSEAVVSQRTTDCETGYVGLRLLTENLLTGGSGNGLAFAHIVMFCFSNFDAKIVIICETTKHFSTKMIKKMLNYTYYHIKD
jgi:hypothetical protein